MDLYLRETANWRLLPGKAQYLSSRLLPVEVESCVLLALYRCSNNSRDYYVDIHGVIPIREEQDQLRKLASTADTSLLLSAIMISASASENREMRRIITTGMDACKKLARLCPESAVYRYLSRHYLDVHQVIQHVVEQIRCSATRMLQRNTTPVVLPDNSHFCRTAGSLLH